MKLTFGLNIFLAKKFQLMEKLPFERRCIAAHLPADLMNMEKIKKVKAKVLTITTKQRCLQKQFLNVNFSYM